MKFVIRAGSGLFLILILELFDPETNCRFGGFFAHFDLILPV
jgi:hypothetical protein